MTLQPGNIIDGKYRIVRELGRGGMGAVYEGENERIHRRVAIKVLHASVSGKADVVQRFEREAQAAGRIGSEHIVEVLDLGNLPSGERFMVMEYLDGESLGQRIKKRKRLTPHELAPILHALLEGLAAAHEAGIVHRDLKPDNVYLINTKNLRDFVKILDFGVSKFSAIGDSDMHETKAGAIMGTPYYMSPEQARGGQIDARSDLYSVGVVMYQAITGRLPFQAQTFNELVFKIALESPEPAELVVPNLDQMFAQIIARSMLREAHLRFQSAREFQAMIAQWMMTNPGAPEINPQRVGTFAPGMAFDPRASQQNMLTSTGPLGLPPGYDPRLAQSGMRGGMPLGASQPGQLGMSQAGQLGVSQPGPFGMSQSQAAFGMSQGSLTMTKPPSQGNAVMIALGLFGTLAVAMSGLVVYKFVIDKPSAVVTNPVASVQAAAQQAPTPATTPSLMPIPRADETATASATTAPVTTGQTTSRNTTSTHTTTGTSNKKTPPIGTGTGGRKISGEL